MSLNPQKNCLSFWFPLIEAAGLPAPETVIIKTDAALDDLLDGRMPAGFPELIHRLSAAGEQVGYPLFLRTGQGSGKHQWRDTCYVESADDLGEHVANLVAWSARVHILGLPTNVWAVRKFLRLKHEFTAFQGMPVAREFRVFAGTSSGQPEAYCVHCYWPEDAVAEGRPSIANWRESLERLNAGPSVNEIVPLAHRAVAAVGGDWSIDFAEDVDGDWWLTDMAVAADSFHMPDCGFARRFQ